MKKCCGCKKDLELKEFNRHGRGYQNWCRSCQKIKYAEYRKAKPEIANTRFRKYYQKYRVRMIKRTRDYEQKIGKKEYVRRYKLYNKNAKFTRYGISEDEYNYLLESQKQKCGMCQRLFDRNKPRSIHIDHCHVTGAVRGILCDGCNLFLGRYEAGAFTKRIEQAQTYLRKTENARDKELLVTKQN